MITCIIRYEIDPFQRDEFKKYAENWGRIIPRCGGYLVGYFLPHEGTNQVAWGLIGFDSLAAYEAYRAALRHDTEGRENFARAQNQRLILREERNFVEVVPGTLGIPPTVSTPEAAFAANTQREKARLFQALHERHGAFMIPNPWDTGTAVMLAQLGFEALATTSAGYAFSAGQQDGTISRQEMLAHVRAIASATPLPVSADLGNGFGDSPEAVAETLRLAAGTGVVGASIEDATGRPDAPIYAFDHAVERVQAAAAAARALPFPFMLTARAENYLHERPDLADTIKRLQAFQEAGADVLYAPGLRTPEDISAVVKSVDRPVNVLIGLAGMRLTLADLAALGVKRVSVGSGLARAALGAFLRAAREMRNDGTFNFAEEAASSKEISAILSS